MKETSLNRVGVKERTMRGVEACQGVTLESGEGWSYEWRQANLTYGCF